MNQVMHGLRKPISSCKEMDTRNGRSDSKCLKQMYTRNILRKRRWKTVVILQWRQLRLILMAIKIQMDNSTFLNLIISNPFNHKISISMAKIRNQTSVDTPSKLFLAANEVSGISVLSSSTIKKVWWTLSMRVQAQFKRTSQKTAQIKK